MSQRRQSRLVLVGEVEHLTANIKLVYVQLSNDGLKSSLLTKNMQNRLKEYLLPS